MLILRFSLGHPTHIYQLTLCFSLFTFPQFDDSAIIVRFLDIYQVTQALATVLQNPKQMADMRRAWGQIDFESVRNQSALVCNCRHEDLVQLLEIDFVAVLERLATRSTEPVRDVIVWADECCDRLIGAGVATARGGEDRSTLSSRSVLIRWGYVTSQIMRDLVRLCCDLP